MVRQPCDPAVKAKENQDVSQCVVYGADELRAFDQGTALDDEMTQHAFFFTSAEKQLVVHECVLLCFLAGAPLANRGGFSFFLCVQLMFWGVLGRLKVLTKRGRNPTKTQREHLRWGKPFRLTDHILK